MKRQRLKREHERLHGEWNTRNDLITRLRQEAIIETDTSVRFKLEKQIQYQEEQQKQSENKLDEIEQSLNLLNLQTPTQPKYLIVESNIQPSTQSTSSPLPQYPMWDYRKLRDLLYSEKWREANQETLILMLNTSKQENKYSLNSNGLKDFPCKDLKIIDRLWVNASNGHFGFSVQKKIWEECGSPIEYNDEWEKFGDRIGWRSGGCWCDYDAELKFHPKYSSEGELPTILFGVISMFGCFGAGDVGDIDVAVLYARAKNCSL
jgi:hypothetical protein